MSARQTGRQRTPKTAQAALATVLLVAVGLAGCIDEGPSVSREGSHTHGEFFECPDGTLIDPGAYGDHHGTTFDPASKCPAPNTPAALTLRAESGHVVRFDDLAFTWDITPSSRGQGQVTAAALLARPDDTGTSAPNDPSAYPVEVDRRQNVRAPSEYTSTWSPQEAGMYHVRAVAVVDGSRVWSKEVMVHVAEIEPTGIVHDVIIKTGGPAATLSPTKLTIRVGDAVRWINDDVLEHTVMSDPDQAETFAFTAPARAATDAAVFFELGDLSYSASSSAVALAGTITVEPPERGL